VIFYRRPQEAKTVLQLVLDSPDELPVYEAEQQILGFDHAQVGGELARQWKLPLLLEECIGLHHNISAAVHFPREVALVHIANVLALMAELHTLNPLDVPPINPLAWEIIGLDAEHVTPQAVIDAQAEIAEAHQLFFGEQG
jgi:HD-like signal output (HDOD) protein